jgi:hypothetical protein
MTRARIDELLRAAAEEGPRDAAQLKRRILASAGPLAGGSAAVPAASGSNGGNWQAWSGSSKALLTLPLLVAGAGALLWASARTRPGEPSVVVAPAMAPTVAPASTTAGPLAAPSPGESGASAAESNEPAPASSVLVVNVESLPPAPARHDAKPRSTLAEELGLLERARASLAGGDAPGALGALDDLDRRFPRTQLRDEALLVRVRALEASGRHSEARARAHAFLEASPGSPYAANIAGAIGEESTP